MQRFEIKIVYEDKDFLVINKPSGLITHQKNLDDKQPSVVDWVTEKYPELKGVGEPFIASGAKVPRAGIVHRLDKETSGLLLIAKNEAVFRYMKKQFQEHTIHKHYYALVFGRPKESSGIINAPLGRIGMKRTTQMTGKKLIDGKESVTEYKTVKNYDKFTLLELSPKTGRTHQLRVHLNSIGHPIVGDQIYGFKKLPDPPNLNRLFLHAYKLEFITPNGESLTLEADLPDELQNVLNVLQ